MAAPPRPPHDRTPSPSLFDQAVSHARRAVAARRTVGKVDPTASPRAATDRHGPGRVELTIALLLVAGPLVTWGGATLFARTAWMEADALATHVAPVAAAARDTDAARLLLASTWQRPTMGATIERVARVLPPDASLARLERGADGRMTMEVAAPDPDRVTNALRRDPALATLRAVAQSQADGTMHVRLQDGR